MPERKKKTFPELLKKFKERTKANYFAKKPRLILIIMANTHDPELSTACKKDVRKVKQVFADICKHIHFELITIEISGDHYNAKNMHSAINNFKISTDNDIAIFYYTGHGFSYQKEFSRRRYPQVDMRPHNKQVDYNKLSFIEEHTQNLAAILSLMRFRGGRITIAIGDCCNTSIPFKRPPDSEDEMNVVQKIMLNTKKRLTKKMYTDVNNTVCILVSSSQHGQPSLTDASIGSIFTHHFTTALANAVKKEPKGSQYLPWLKLIKDTSTQAFKDSKGYEIGKGKTGKQKAVFEVFIDRFD